jgi:F-type H+-transporting ATPase subunit delta
MGGDVVAGRYARALFLTIQGAGEREQAGRALDQFAAAMTVPDGLRTIILNPFYSKTRRAELLQRLIDVLADGMQVPPSAGRFLRFLLHKNRFDLVGVVASAFTALLDEESGRLGITVSTARPLDAKVQQTIQQHLEQALHRPIGLTLHVDPALLGGMRMQAGSRLIDGTIRGQFDRVRRLATEEQA